VQGNKKQSDVIIHTPEYVRGMHGLNVYAIYPDFWKDKWGEPPCFGHVRESSPYWAKYAAYTCGLVPFNATFKPKAVLIRKPFNHGKPKFRPGGPINRPVK
jgi:hypothetical protein